MKISKPGKYRTKRGLRAEVTSTRNNKAIGWVEEDGQSHPSAWGTEEGNVWHGRWGDDLVDEWRDPVTQSITLELCLNTAGEAFIRTAGNYGQAIKVLARRTITITEGEGMSTGE